MLDQDSHAQRGFTRRTKNDGKERKRGKGDNNQKSKKWESVSYPARSKRIEVECPYLPRTRMTRQSKWRLSVLWIWASWGKQCRFLFAPGQPSTLASKWVEHAVGRGVCLFLLSMGDRLVQFPHSSKYKGPDYPRSHHNVMALGVGNHTKLSLMLLSRLSPRDPCPH